MLQPAPGPFPLPPNKVLLVGRNADSDIHFENPGVSRRHAEIRVVAGRVWIRDSESYCGTLVNGREVPGDRLHRLWPGDVIQVAAVWSRLTATVALDERWLLWDGGVVARVARYIREDGVYAAFAVLADVLEEAGCAEAELLALCRRPEEWAHGDWLVDAILGEADTAHPRFDESCALLRAAGWRVHEEEVTGPPHAPLWRVTGRNHLEGAIDATGKSRAEAWHRAVEQARSLGMMGRSVVP
jgi:hypothetical protein